MPKRRGRPSELKEPVRVTVFIETTDRDRLAKEYGSISAAIRALVEADKNQSNNGKDE